jgi:DNA-binding response OmpR family regulator
MDLILLDARMPGSQGCKRLQADPVMHPLPVLLMTTRNESADEVFGLGAPDYVTRPLEHEEIIARPTTQLALRTAVDAGARSYDMAGRMGVGALMCEGPSTGFL